MSSLLLAIALATAPAAEGRGREAGPRAACSDRPPAPFVLGPATASLVARAHLDPTLPSALVTWLELRRLVADHEGDLRLEIWLVRQPPPRDPRADRVRRFASRMAARDRLQAALRQVALRGVERLSAMLTRASGTAELARELGVDAKVLDDDADPCADARIEASTEALEQRLAEQGKPTLRPPVFEVGDVVDEDSPALDKLRPELARVRNRERLAKGRRRPVVTGEAKPRSDAMRRPPLTGVVLGGIGLRHRLVINARDEDDPTLFLVLPRVLRWRSAHPGRLAVHIVARGESLGAQDLRQRLCAARRIDRVAEYVRWLAEPPESRRTAAAESEALLHELDSISEETCAGELDPAALGLPDSMWLDGLPRGTSELDDLDGLLRAAEAAERPLAPILRPSAPP
jgi:hypothetical protein